MTMAQDHLEAYRIAYQKAVGRLSKVSKQACLGSGKYQEVFCSHPVYAKDCHR